MFTKIKTPNQTAGRFGQKPEIIVIHITAGHSPGVEEWIKNPESMVSYHFLIKKTGEIVQFVETKDTAWHAGKVVKPLYLPKIDCNNPNYYSIGVALEAKENEELSFQQFFTTSLLIKMLSKANKIKIDDKHIIPHNWINSGKSCPGEKVDISAIINLAKLEFKNA